MTISSIQPAAARPVAAAGKAPEAPAVPEARARTPAMDTYTPEEPHTPSGRYWPERDGEGRRSIRFDRPGEPEGEDPKAERCMGSTDQVYREIERLKKRQQELERQLAAETDGQRRQTLEKQLDQVEQELRQKDNDAYRQRHSRFTRLS